MYMDLKDYYWWLSMKIDIAEFVANYKICQQVKVEYQKPVGKPQPLSILKWKWEDTTMHFVLGLPRGKRVMMLYG